MNINIQKLLSKEVYCLLKQTANLYTPALNEKLDLQEYSNKLSLNAEFVLCKKDDKTLGYVVFYKNMESKEFYVPLICVKQEYQRMGLASKMLSVLENSSGGGIFTHSVGSTQS